uniref:BTB domain-containing protein n=1 Tax=Odontella aurita TaxID=265563 RepID=A0A7S4IXT5_9STRA|mmetsp:Transcript_32390/g.97067  ORF Transcript_32390/g.97067 Transcript_32390/m.97067 type:complete len:276 (+) Transcript_32390:197-1024(+)
MIHFGTIDPTSRSPNAWRDEPYDVHVKVEGRTFSAHRSVLASVSDYFSALFFENRFADSSAGLISLPSVSADAFEKFLRWAYLDEVDETDSMVLLEVSSRLQCQGIITKIEKNLLRKIDHTTCLQLWELAEEMGLIELEKASKREALKTYEKVVGSEYFSSLSADHLSCLLSSDDLVVSNERNVFSSVIAWAKAQPEQRNNAEQLEKIFSRVRYIMLPESFLEETIEEEKLRDRPTIMAPLAKSYEKKHEWVQRARRYCMKHWGDKSLQHWGYEG